MTCVEASFMGNPQANDRLIPAHEQGDYALDPDWKTRRAGSSFASYR
jgi:hypothetical protein